MVHPFPLAGPRQTRHVPMSSWDGSTGSTMKGAGVVIVNPSLFTSALETTGTEPKSAGVHGLDCEHRWMETPAPLFTYQFSGLAGSMATGPPSPVRIWGQSVVGPVLLFTPAVPLAPNPSSI